MTDKKSGGNCTAGNQIGCYMLKWPDSARQGNQGINVGKVKNLLAKGVKLAGPDTWPNCPFNWPTNENDKLYYSATVKTFQNWFNTGKYDYVQYINKTDQPRNRCDSESIVTEFLPAIGAGLVVIPVGLANPFQGFAKAGVTGGLGASAYFYVSAGLNSGETQKQNMSYAARALGVTAGAAVGGLLGMMDYDIAVPAEIGLSAAGFFFGDKLILPVIKIGSGITSFVFKAVGKLSWLVQEGLCWITKGFYTACHNRSDYDLPSYAAKIALEWPGPAKGSSNIKRQQIFNALLTNLMVWSEEPETGRHATEKYIWSGIQYAQANCQSFKQLTGTAFAPVTEPQPAYDWTIWVQKCVAAAMKEKSNKLFLPGLSCSNELSKIMAQSNLSTAFNMAVQFFSNQNQDCTKLKGQPAYYLVQFTLLLYNENKVMLTPELIFTDTPTAAAGGKGFYEMFVQPNMQHAVTNVIQNPQNALAQALKSWIYKDAVGKAIFVFINQSYSNASWQSGPFTPAPHLMSTALTFTNQSSLALRGKAAQHPLVNVTSDPRVVAMVIFWTTMTDYQNKNTVTQQLQQVNLAFIKHAQKQTKRYIGMMAATLAAVAPLPLNGSKTALSNYSNVINAWNAAGLQTYIKAWKETAGNGVIKAGGNGGGGNKCSGVIDAFMKENDLTKLQGQAQNILAAKTCATGPYLPYIKLAAISNNYAINVLTGKFFTVFNTVQAQAQVCDMVLNQNQTSAAVQALKYWLWRFQSSQNSKYITQMLANIKATTTTVQNPNIVTTMLLTTSKETMQQREQAAHDAYTQTNPQPSDVVTVALYTVFTTASDMKGASGHLQSVDSAVQSYKAYMASQDYAAFCYAVGGAFAIHLSGSSQAFKNYNNYYNALQKAGLANYIKKWTGAVSQDMAKEASVLFHDAALELGHLLKGPIKRQHHG